MAKQAIFLITSNGVDGREKTVYEFASTDEQDRDKVFEQCSQRGFNHTVEIVVDLTEHKAKALAKLDAVDLLSLGLEQPFAKRRKKAKRE